MINICENFNMGTKDFYNSVGIIFLTETCNPIAGFFCQRIIWEKTIRVKSQSTSLMITTSNVLCALQARQHLSFMNFYIKSISRVTHTSISDLIFSTCSFSSVSIIIAMVKTLSLFYIQSPLRLNVPHAVFAYGCIRARLAEPHWLIDLKNSADY